MLVCFCRKLRKHCTQFSSRNRFTLFCITAVLRFVFYFEWVFKLLFVAIIPILYWFNGNENCLHNWSLPILNFNLKKKKEEHFRRDIYQGRECKGLICQRMQHGISDLQFKLNPFSRFLTLAVERGERVMTQRGRTRNLHRLTEVRALCRTNYFLCK